MISSKRRDIRRGKTSKLSKNLERAYKAKKCRECKVVVTRMDFAKILGKFTKVKIQYESSSTPKVKQVSPQISPNSNARLKRNENGMVLIHRKSYNQHPVKDLTSSKKSKIIETSSHSSITSKSIRDINILKENNRQKQTSSIKENVSNDIHSKQIKSDLKQYGIIFVDPSTINNNDKNKITLLDLLPYINKNILPSDEWCIDYFPKSEEPKDDKIYDRIAAELEDLMYNEKKDSAVENKNEGVENHSDDFPSIMDILNDNTTENSFKLNDTDNSGPKPNLESSDVEAMLLGKPNEINKIVVMPLASEDNVEKSLIEDVEQYSEIQESSIIQESSENQETSVNQDVNNKSNEAIKEDSETVDENPNSPSILDEALQKGIEEHLPALEPEKTTANGDTEEAKANSDSIKIEVTPMEVDVPEEPKSESKIENTVTKTENNEDNSLPRTDVTHVVFNNVKNEKCIKSVTCPKNLKYTIELDTKLVEFIGAPKFITSLEDLQVLLQIVNDSELDSLHVSHL